MLHATEVSAAQLDQEAESLGLVLPIEQTAVWMEYESTIPDRAYWGSYIIYDDEAPMALVSFMDYMNRLKPPIFARVPLFAILTYPQ